MTYKAINTQKNHFYFGLIGFSIENLLNAWHYNYIEKREKSKLDIKPIITMANKIEFLQHFCRENKSLGLTEESDIRKIDINDSFEHKSSGYNSCGSTEEIRPVWNEEIDSKEIQSVGDREECPSKASCDTSDLIYDAVSKIIRDIDNEEELKDDNTSNKMCKELNTDNENAQDEILNRAKDYSCVDEQLKDESDDGNQSVEEFVTCIIDEIIGTVVPTVGPTIVLNGCDQDDVDARLQRQNAFDEDICENTISTFKPDSGERSMPTKYNNSTDSTNDEYRLEETKIDKLSCKPSHHPNLCSPVSIDSQLSNADSRESLCNRTSRGSDIDRHSDSRDSSYDRRSRRSDRSSSTDSSVSAADGSPRVGATSGRADSKDSMCDGLSRYGSASSLVSNRSEYEVEVRTLFVP